MFKSFFTSIVGDDPPPPSRQTAPTSQNTKPAPRSQSQPGSGRSSPLSESGFPMFGRRMSSSSTHSVSEAGEPDLSHLSKEERAQIEAVIARARQIQDEGEQQIRSVCRRS